MSSSSDNNINNNNNNRILSIVTPETLSLEVKDPVNPQALEQAQAIFQELRPTLDGPVSCEKLSQVAARLGDIEDNSKDNSKDNSSSSLSSSLIITKEACRQAFEELSTEERTALVNIHGRIQAFAEAQRKSITDMEVDIPGGKAGHTVSPCQAAGCYAPGGRYPLPSSVLMTVVTARAAGCETVILASPRPAPITMAAAYVAGADTMLGVGGAQAICSMAYGLSTSSSSDDDDDNVIIIPKCDVICGPGNQWVTAAKSIVQGYCGIDMLAGPSEVLVLCDETASPQIVAADLIAQAEHDIVARAILVTTCSQLEQAVNDQVISQLATLPEPNQSTARTAMKQSFSVVCGTIEECIQVSDTIAPEHLEIHTKDAWNVGRKCRHYGGMFVGSGAAEVLGDYGAGPNHTLPTGGTGRYTGGLSVFDFLRIRTYLKIEPKDLSSSQSQSMVSDTITMARLEGLEGHARAAEQRKIE